MDMHGNGEAHSKSDSVPKHKPCDLVLQQETDLFVCVCMGGEINSLFTGKRMWGDGVMNFQIKLGKCFQAKEEMFNHIFLQRRLKVSAKFPNEMSPFFSVTPVFLSLTMCRRGLARDLNN